MRKNQISVGIQVPNFVTLKLYQDSYAVIVALPVTSAIANKLYLYVDGENTEIMSPSTTFNRKFYCVKITRIYKYSTSFLDSCFINARKDFLNLKMQARLAHIDAIKEEINNIDDELREI